jgi:hypothetical protein
MEALRATAAAATAATPTTTPGAGSTAAGATTPAKSFATRFAEAEKALDAGEHLTRVKGHEYARIKGGQRDQQCVNLSANGRSGQAFDLVWRDGRCFHVYGGKGVDHVVVEVGTSKKDSTSAAKTGASSTAAAATGGTPATA